MVRRGLAPSRTLATGSLVQVRCDGLAHRRPSVEIDFFGGGYVESSKRSG
jgi:hypothetical protein